MNSGNIKTTPVVSDMQGATLIEHNAVASALLEATASLAEADGGVAIIRRICEALVSATPHIRLAWAWVGPPDATQLRPSIAAGPGKQYADDLLLRRNALVERGPVFRALLNNEVHFTEISTNAEFRPWREAAEKYGFRVAAAMPLRLPDPTQRGIIVFYADQADYFERVGLAPFRAICRLSEAALTQSALKYQLERQAASDGMTGLLNRRAMNEALDRQFGLARRHHGVFSVIMFDIDHFKAINDQYGHAVGDDVICQLASVANSQLRGEDQLARWGGEEFLCLLPESDRSGAELAAEKLKAAIAAHFSSSASPVKSLTASFGVASFEISMATLDQLLLRADKAMYSAKDAGRNRVVVG
jgi:diguanylate cyclase (GGDEF)-like protein